jgi:hypothetical protein
MDKDSERHAVIGFTELVVGEGKDEDAITGPLEPKLLPHLNYLVYKLAERRALEGEARNAFLWDLAMLPYSLRAMYGAYQRFTREARALVEREGHRTDGAMFMPVQSDVDGLCFAIDAFLDAGRRAQNAVLVHVNAAARGQLPSSMNKATKRLHDGQHKLPAEWRDLILSYWDRYGLELKQYRDLAQHHVLVASNVTMFRTERGEVGINLLLPSNPYVLGKRALVWNNPPVHAQSFLRVQFQQLLAFAFMITRSIVEALPGERRQLVGVHPRAPITIGAQIGGHRPPSDDQIEDETRRLLNSLLKVKVPVPVLAG